MSTWHAEMDPFGQNFSLKENQKQKACSPESLILCLILPASFSCSSAFSSPTLPSIYSFLTRTMKTSAQCFFLCEIRCRDFYNLGIYFISVNHCVNYIAMSGRYDIQERGMHFTEKGVVNKSQVGRSLMEVGIVCRLHGNGWS